VGNQLYGTTQYGGATNAQCAQGCGTVFAVSESGTERILYRFKGGADGALPLGGLIAVGTELYGTTSAGGSGSACYGGCGTVFELGTDGSAEKVLYAFSGGKDGALPAAGLVSLGGSFYGTTEYGGQTTALCPSGCGTIFKIGASGTESVVHAFKGGSDGAGPVARPIAVDATLYGTTQYGGRTTAYCGTGCGTLFRATASGAMKTLHSFSFGSNSGDGAYPAAAPAAMNGELYGTTLGGGSSGDGAVYEVDPNSGAESVLHSFVCCQTSTDGAYPYSHLEHIGGLLYGTTHSGGTTNHGTIFSITSAGTENVLYDFRGKPDGAYPESGMTLHDGALYGTTTGGGSQSEGTIFSLTP